MDFTAKTTISEFQALNLSPLEGLRKACDCGNAVVVKFILGKNGFPSQKFSDPDPIIIAASNKHFNVLDEFIGYRCFERSFEEALAMACYEGDAALVAFLLGRGVSALSPQFPCLHAAVKANRPEIARMLLDIHPQVVQVKGEKGETPLHIAARENSVAVMEMLMPLIPLNSLDDNGDTPLNYAFKDGCRKAARMLLAFGAAPGIFNHENDNAFTIAVRHNFVDMGEMVKDTVKADTKVCFNNIPVKALIENYGHRDFLDFFEQV